MHTSNFQSMTIIMSIGDQNQKNHILQFKDYIILYFLTFFSVGFINISKHNYIYIYIYINSFSYNPNYSLPTT
jgi:hypothetical protein